MKKLLFLIPALLAAYFVFRPSDEFSIDLITHHHPHDARWDVHPLKPEEKAAVKSALGQKFIYFGCGAQAFIFFSEDNNYVLKLFKKKRYEAPLWIRALPMPGLRYKDKKIGIKEKNLIKDFTSYKLAFDVLQNETGLLLVHLNPSTDLQQQMTLSDEKKEYKIDLDQVDFILQKRGDLVCSGLESFIQKNDMRGAKMALNSLLQMFRSRCDKGIADHEPNLGKNFAFIGTQAVQIDIGRFSLEPVEPPGIRRDFKDWLGSKSPELLNYFEEQYDYFFPETRQL